jgi:hypothetical protein
MFSIDDMTLAKWLGHSNPSTTKQYYREIMSDFEATQAELLNKNFTKKVDTNFDTKSHKKPIKTKKTANLTIYTFR